MRDAGEEETVMIKDSSSLGWTLLLAVALVFSPTVDGMAAGTKHKAKASQPAKSRSKESPPLVRMTLEPKAMDILKATSERLAAARTMSLL
jgi:hypothetical protein